MDIQLSIKLRQWLFSFSSGIICFFLGVFIITIQAVNSLNNETQKQLNTAVIEINNTLNTSQKIMGKIMPIIDQPCDELKKNLIDIIVRTPDIQTISVIENSLITCSTYDNLTNIKAFNINGIDNQLILITSKMIRPGKAIGVIRKSKGNRYLSISINSQSFFSSLYLINPNGNFKIQSLGTWTDKNGKVHKEPSKYNIISKSKKYDFNVHTYITLKRYLSEIIYRYGWVLILLSVLSIVISHYVYINTKRNLSVYLLKKSIKNNDFIPYAQPIMDSHGLLKGLEILIRWKSKDLGLVNPNTFIPLAEQTGLIIPITQQLIINTIQILEIHKISLPKDFHIGINICPQHFKKENQSSLIESCQMFLSSPISQSIHLTLELTERGIIDDYDDARLLFQSLRKMGIKIAVDDFGTGNASLSVLNNLKFDYIKIDKTFIDLIGSPALSAPLVDNIIDLAKRLNVSLIAEGVEKKVQVDYLKENQVDYIQGYFYGKPIPLIEFIQVYLTKY